MSISSLIIALLVFMSLLSLGIAIMVVRALRPAKPDAKAAYSPSAPDSILDPQINVDSLATSTNQLASKTNAETINPYQPHTAAVHTARQ